MTAIRSCWIALALVATTAHADARPSTPPRTVDTQHRVDNAPSTPSRTVDTQRRDRNAPSTPPRTVNTGRHPGRGQRESPPRGRRGR